MMQIKQRQLLNEVPILAYHFTGTPLDEEDAPYTVSTNSFDQQMHYLAQEGYRCLSLADLRCLLLEGKKTYDRAVVITFDDGRACVYREAFPILKKHGLTATVFLITSRLEHGNFLNRSQILEMAEYGISFESHGVTHARLSSLDVKEIMAEAAQSRRQLENLLDRPVKFFAYPYGDHSSEVQHALELSGYNGAVCSKAGRATEISDLFALPRLGVRRTDSHDIFLQKLLGNGTDVIKNNAGRFQTKLTTIVSRVARHFKK